ARQFHRPGRVVLPLEREASPIVPQCGQIGPSGQSHASTYAKAASSSAKCGAFRADFMANLFVGRHSTDWAFYVKCNALFSIIYIMRHIGSAISQTPARSQHPAILLRHAVTAIKPRHLAYPTVFECGAERGLGCRVARAFAGKDCDRRNPAREQFIAATLDAEDRATPLDRPAPRTHAP